MKKCAGMALTGILAVGSLTMVYADTGNQTAILQDTKIRFNGGEIQSIQSYNIDGYNFVRARDITNALDMSVSAIQNGNKGIMIDPYNSPASKAASEKLTRQTAKVKVEKGELIYDGSVSEAECFLLNGRYYFKLADFADAGDYAKEGALELVTIEAKSDTAKKPFMPTFYGIEIRWDAAERVVDVSNTTIDLQEMFDAIRGSKILTMEAEGKTVQKDSGKMEDTSEKSKAQTALTAAPKEGELPANILIDRNKAAYLDDAMTKPDTDNFTTAYLYMDAGRIGQCTWYARGRMLETVGDFIRYNPFTGSGVDNWVKKAKSDECLDVDGITDPYAIQPRSIVVWKGHAAFVEWVEYDSKGKPVKVYFTEANADHQATDRIVGVYYPDFDGIVKAWDFDKFINRGEFIGYVIAK